VSRSASETSAAAGLSLLCRRRAVTDAPGGGGGGGMSALLAEMIARNASAATAGLQAPIQAQLLGEAAEDAEGEPAAEEMAADEGFGF